MKLIAATLMALLLLGVCSARSLERSNSREMDDDMKPKEADNSKADQENRREGAQNKAEDQFSQQWTQFRETIYQKLRSMYQQMTSSGNSFQLDEMPRFSDPIMISDIDGKYAMLDANYKNVLFLGLNSADQALIKVDTDSQEATVTLKLKLAQIRGDYAVSDTMKSMAGSFNMLMHNDVSYVVTYHYEQEGSNVKLLHSSGKLQYNGLTNHYDNADFPEFVQFGLQTIILRPINEKLHAEVTSKLSDRVLQRIQEVVSGSKQEDPAEKVMREGIKNAIRGIQQVLSSRGVSSIELSSDDKEMEHNNLRAKISSVKLNGIEKLYMASNQVSNEKSDKIRATLQLAIDRPTATAIVDIHETNNENAPFQKIKVDFDMEQLMAELRLEKPARQSGLNLDSFQAKVNRIRPMGTEKFEREVRDLIKEKLTDHMKRYLEKGVERFILNEYVAITSQGVLPPIPEKQSVLSQM